LKATRGWNGGLDTGPCSIWRSAFSHAQPSCTAHLCTAAPCREHRRSGICVLSPHDGPMLERLRKSVTGRNPPRLKRRVTGRRRPPCCICQPSSPFCCYCTHAIYLCLIYSASTLMLAYARADGCYTHRSITRDQDLTSERHGTFEGRLMSMKQSTAFHMITKHDRRRNDFDTSSYVRLSAAVPSLHLQVVYTCTYMQEQAAVSLRDVHDLINHRSPCGRTDIPPPAPPRP